MTQIMTPKLISPRHKCSIRRASGLVQTGFAKTSTDLIWANHRTPESPAPPPYIPFLR
jgi:hypothetical protein